MELHKTLSKLAAKRMAADRVPADIPVSAETEPKNIIQDDPGILVQRARTYIRAHFTEPLSLNEVANTLAVNPAYLSSIFKSERGESYSKFILRLRMERAALLLWTYSAGKVNDIALEVGYSSTKHFYSVFKDYFGVTPNEYRNQNKGK